MNYRELPKIFAEAILFWQRAAIGWDKMIKLHKSNKRGNMNREESFGRNLHREICSIVIDLLRVPDIVLCNEDTMKIERCMHGRVSGSSTQVK